MQCQTEAHLDELKRLIVERDFKHAEILVEGAPSINRRWDAFRAYFSSKQKSVSTKEG
jgi:hypothetical protein